MLEKTHPEKENDEVFLGNVTDPLYPYHIKKTSHRWISQWKTGRYGDVAYDINDKPVQNMRPFFVKRDEYLKFVPQKEK